MDGLIGYTGFIGSNLVRQHRFEGLYNTSNIDEMQGKHFHMLVCAAPYAEKWKANQNPAEDFKVVNALVKQLREVKADRFCLISTVDVYPVTHGSEDEYGLPVPLDERFECAGHPNHPYGKHRLLLEERVKEIFDRAYIFRLPALFGEGLKKNVLFDMMHSNMLEKINPESVFQWYGVERLWNDMSVVMQNDIRLVNLVTEPMKTEYIRDVYFPWLKGVGSNPSPTAHYDIQTLWDGLFGSESGYVETFSDVLARMARFVAA